jgi:hypothetical protein
MVQSKWHKWRNSSLIGLRVGRLKVLSLEQGGTKNKGRNWLCQCDCGNTIIVPTGRLSKGNTKSCGCLRHTESHSDLTGKRFGKLTVIEPTGVRELRSMWRCLCDCGTEKNVRADFLRYKMVRSCGCLRNTPGGYHLNPGDSTRNMIIRTYQDNAKHHGLIWSLSKDQTIVLLAGDCFYCGTPPSRTRKMPNKYGAFTYNGIDRLDNTKGYIIGNVVPCCTTCNLKKHSMPFSEFYNWIMKVSNHLKRQGVLPL